MPKRKKENREIKAREDESEAPTLNLDELEKKFDKVAVSVYKRIPADKETEIESLADSEIGLREVMKALLKLEMGRFIKILPGERVKRNL